MWGYRRNKTCIWMRKWRSCGHFRRDFSIFVDIFVFSLGKSLGGAGCKAVDGYRRLTRRLLFMAFCASRIAQVAERVSPSSALSPANPRNSTTTLHLHLHLTTLPFSTKYAALSRLTILIANSVHTRYSQRRPMAGFLMVSALSITSTRRARPASSAMIS